MNELINDARVLLARDELSPFDLGFQLNDLLLSAIASADRPPLRQAPGSIPGLDRGVASIMKVANDFQQIPATVGDILIDRPRRNILRRQRSGGAG